jgi:hypothetical protein
MALLTRLLPMPDGGFARCRWLPKFKWLGMRPIDLPTPRPKFSMRLIVAPKNP